MTPIYESSNVEVTWLGEDLSHGWAEDTYLSIEPINARTTAKFGADGQMAISKMAGKGSVIILTLMQTAPLNKVLARIAANQDMLGGEVPAAPFTVKDLTGDSLHMVALNAVLTELPTTSFGSEMGEKTWTWICESYFETDNVADLTSELTKYIKFS